MDKKSNAAVVWRGAYHVKEAPSISIDLKQTFNVEIKGSIECHFQGKIFFNLICETSKVHKTYELGVGPNWLDFELAVRPSSTWVRDFNPYKAGPFREYANVGLLIEFVPHRTSEFSVAFLSNFTINGRKLYTYTLLPRKSTVTQPSIEVSKDIQEPIKESILETPSKIEEIKGEIKMSDKLMSILDKNKESAVSAAKLETSKIALETLQKVAVKHLPKELGKWCGTPIGQIVLANVVAELMPTMTKNAMAVELGTYALEASYMNAIEELNLPKIISDFSKEAANLAIGE